MNAGQQGKSLQPKDSKGNFLITEFGEDHKYLMHIEDSMNRLLSFYTTIYLAVLGGLISLMRFFPRIFQDIIDQWMLVAILVIFSIVCIYEFFMYLELRVRKIKVLEQLANIRSHIMSTRPELSNVLILITSIDRCPQYLRRPSSEWYTVLYLSTLNSFPVAFTLVAGSKSINNVPFWPLSFYNILAAIILILLIFTFQFVTATKYCYFFDIKREVEFDITINYGLLESGGEVMPPGLNLLNFVALWLEKRWRPQFERSIKEASHLQGREKHKEEGPA